MTLYPGIDPKCFIAAYPTRPVAPAMRTVFVMGKLYHVPMRLITLSALLFLAAIPLAFAGPFDDGVAAYKAGDYDKAFKILKPLAELDNSQSADAQERIAHLYERGNGVAKDPVAAAKWFQKAADQGNVTAQAHLGRLFRSGVGVAKDPKQAARWSIKAASQGNPIAESTLGYMALEGSAGPASPAAAAGWFKKSADQGDTSAMIGLGGLYEQGSGVPKDVVQAYKWYALASVDTGEYDADLPVRAKKAKEALGAKMAPAQVAQAGKLVEDFVPAGKR